LEDTEHFWRWHQEEVAESDYCGELFTIVLDESVRLRKQPKMGDTWITDITHYLTNDGGIAATTGPARRFAEFLTTLVVHATSHSLNGATDTRVKCRRRPARTLCTGKIETDVDAETEESFGGVPPAGIMALLGIGRRLSLTARTTQLPIDRS
jgi:hypothetical protein